jgi:hypothetical protein
MKHLLSVLKITKMAMVKSVEVMFNIFQAAGIF